MYSVDCSTPVRPTGERRVVLAFASGERRLSEVAR
jgi:hypothetical protein